MSYDAAGAVYRTRDLAGATNTQDGTVRTNYTAPARLTPNGQGSPAMNLSYTGWLDPEQSDRLAPGSSKTG